ncbi:MAG: cytochrome c [Candidatus Hydrogenedentes bacterium]|nr:cytochrome c [Candidatus Hydrogenedentota bacterium]
MTGLSAILVVVQTIAGAEAPPAPPPVTVEMLDALPQLPGEIGPLPKLAPSGESPGSDPVTELGKLLFFDKRFSPEGTMGCATCHVPALAFGDGQPTASGRDGKPLPRHSPTLLNIAFNTVFFWDGRAASLDEQARMPLMDTHEIGMASEEALNARLQELPEYPPLFRQVFNAPPNTNDAYTALAVFERTLVTPNARFDLYAQGQKDALTGEEKQGLIVFIGKGSCTQCHLGPNLTDNKFHNLGVSPGEPETADPGRFRITHEEEDRAAFKTPTLRNIAVTPPYMHDGSQVTLEEVVEFYDKGGGTSPGKSPLIFPLNLSAEEKVNLVAFLRTLTGEIPDVAPPDIFKNDPSYRVATAPAGTEMNYVPALPAQISTLAELMAQGLHEQFTALGFSVWHSRPYTENRRAMAKTAAKRLAEFAPRVKQFEPTGLEGADHELFTATAGKLEARTASLAKSAEFGTLSEIRHLFTQVEGLCLTCHQRFRPDLVWVEAPPATAAADQPADNSSVSP